MDSTNASRPSPWLRVLALLVLAIAAWLLLRMLIGVLTTVAWLAATVVALIGIFWALRVLRR
jgi:hypothetical protein